jgi:Concanavalin A-like lectin/glucanases superfamily
MHKLLYSAPTLIALFLVTHITAHGQPGGLYCASGLHPDGYIDFSGLPPAPTIPGPGIPSPPVTAILPVKDVPGLTVSITIPALVVEVPLTQGPAYSVNGGTLQLNGLPNAGNFSTVLTLTFNQPIAGIGLNAGNLSGRLLYTYNLQVGTFSTTANAPPFSTTASGNTFEIFAPRTANLQMVALDTTFQTATVQFGASLLEDFRGVTLSNIRVQSTSAPDPASSIPTNGLQQWLRADKATTSPLPPFSATGPWQDQSGNGHDATPTPGHEPTLTADGHTCQAAWFFNGSSSFDFNLPIAGLTEMTVFLVANSAKDPPDGSYFSESAAILWTEDASWGNTFVSPYQTHLYARFGTTQVGNNLSYIRPGGGIGQDFTITRAVHNNGTDQLYVNGLRVFSQRGKLAALSGVTGAGTIGEGTNNTYFNGEISEILVYNRVLSNQEAAQVESYLRNKYGTQ